MMFFGAIRNGKLDLDRDAIRNEIQEMGDGDVLVSIEKLGNTRSARQNAYLHGVVLPYAVRYFREQGWDCDDLSVKEVMRQKFLKRCIVNAKTGDVEEYYASTASLTTEEFNYFVEEVRMWVSQNLGGYIPDPE